MKNFEEIIKFPLKPPNSEEIKYSVLYEFSKSNRSKRRLLAVSNPPICLKLIPRDELRSKAKVKHLFNEKKILGLLNHSQTPTLYQ